jgi:hypothetical protein
LRRASALILALLLLVALAGCGEDGEPEPGTDATVPASPTDAGPDPEDEPGQGSEPVDDEQAVRDAVEAFLASPDAATVCDELLTARALRNAYGSRQACLQSRPRPTLADRVRFRAVAVGNAGSEVVAVPEGGLYDGIEVSFELVPAGDGWRIDGLEADVPVGP